ncbi:MAG: hypothetical protein AB4041_20125 [Microcystaceae cyanobacterium]
MNQIPPPDKNAAKRTLRNLFLILLTVGISLGVLLSIGLVKLLNNWGLTDKPQPTQVD